MFISIHNFCTFVLFSKHRWFQRSNIGREEVGWLHLGPLIVQGWWFSITGRIWWVDCVHVASGIDVPVVEVVAGVASNGLEVYVEVTDVAGIRALSKEIFNLIFRKLKIESGYRNLQTTKILSWRFLWGQRSFCARSCRRGRNRRGSSWDGCSRGFQSSLL